MAVWPARGTQPWDLLLKDYVDSLIGATIPDASTTVKGKVELATVAETTAGASEALAVTPAGVKGALAPLPVRNIAIATFLE